MLLQRRQLGRASRGAEIRTIIAPLLPTGTRTNSTITVLRKRKQNETTGQHQLFSRVFIQLDSLRKVQANVTVENLMTRIAFELTLWAITLTIVENLMHG
jgi:hypothetical protein